MFTHPRYNIGVTSSSSLPPLPPRPAHGDGLPPLPPHAQAQPGALPPLRRDGGTPPAPVIELSRERPVRRSRRGAAVALGAVALVAAGAVGGVTATRVFPADTASTAPPSSTVATTASPTPAPTTTVSAGTTLEDAITQVAPSVVTIRTGSGMGSGVVLAPRGLIVTNEHVVDGADVVQIVTSDGRRQVGRVVRHDPDQDLAVIRPTSTVPTGVQLADGTSNPLRVGDQVFAIGSPFGLQNTVTAGIVSALNRPGESGIPMIQTDAPINPGNSGGGLFDLEGRLVGIPTSIRAPITGNVGIGFAVPASRVSALVNSVP